ncbi:hypothetical protein GGF32_000369 [Allomyces javanicus]|nr:hypothetical protein GGF32_000369 [Allomyces javanicus]
MTLTLLIATTYLLDSHTLLGKIIGFGRKTLQQTAFILNMIVTKFCMHKYHRFAGYRSSKNLPLSIRNLQNMLKTLRDLDPLNALLDHDGNVGGDDSLACVFEWIPWLCGQIQFMMLQLQLDTIVAPNTHWDILINALQLYEACRQYGNGHGIDVSWPDLDRFIRLYDKESLFAGRVPDTAEGFLKTYSIISGISVGSINAHMGLQNRTPRNSTMQWSSSRRRQLKARSYTTLLFRDHFFRRRSSTSPPSLLQRSSDFIARIHNIVEDLVTTGTVSPTRLGDADANFSGRSLRPILDKIGLAPTAVQRSKRPDGTATLQFIEEVVAAEWDLLRCEMLSLHLRGIAVLTNTIDKINGDLEERYGPGTFKDCLLHLEGVLPRIFADWWTGERNPLVFSLYSRSRPLIHDAAEYLRSWATEPCGEGLVSSSNGEVGTAFLVKQREWRID